MGVSTDAELAFGIDFGEDYPLYPRDEDGDVIYEDDDDGERPDLADFLARKAGIENPYDKVPHDIYHGYDHEAYENWKKENPWFDKATSEYFSAKNRLEQACPVEIHWHCSYDYPQFVLALKGTHISASRGTPEKVNFERLSAFVTDEKLAKARKFCEENGLPPFYGADWLLFSMWG